MNDSRFLQGDYAAEGHIVHAAIEAYMRDLVSHTDANVLLAMEEFARQRDFPIVYRLVGIFLEMQARMIGAKRVFEFGSGYGYSAYWFAKAVGAEGDVICSDMNPATGAAAEKYLTTVDLWQRIDFKVEKAQDAFTKTKGLFDICYNDADKEGYPEIWQMAKNRIRSGGLYIADNVLWSGRVALQNDLNTACGLTADETSPAVMGAGTPRRGCTSKRGNYERERTTRARDCCTPAQLHGLDS